MKKVLLFLAAAAMLAVSCAKDPQGLIGDQTKVTFTVDASQVVTRAVTGTHGTASRLMVGVYIKSGTTYNYIQAISQSNTVSEWPTVVSLDLAKNETYKLVFWADEGTDAYTINWANGTVAETATTIAGNATNRDAYYKMVEITTNGANGGAITLTRPLAQVNVGTNDLAAYKAAAVYDGNIETQVVVSGVVPGMNLLTGEASTGEPVDLTFSYADNLDATLVSGGNNYGYLGMNFVLCPGDATLTAQISLRKDDAAQAINEFTVSYLPVKTNYRTNIVGKLLTGTVQYSVDVDTDFADDLQKLVAPTFESIEALNTYLAGLKEGTPDGDQGDINPEQATVTALGTVSGTPQIILPKILGGVDIRLAFEYNGTVEIVYADGATDEQKPANIFFYAQNLNTLVATVPQSHFELLSGSIVTNKAIVATNTNTFVIQNGARVGTAEIKKGNASIAGTVTTISVPTGAKADDDNNPVQVFLEKVSAVDEIILNAKTDVVVEQPADQIEVENTEYKVAVYVYTNDCSATAQNGGQIYIELGEGVTSCTVAADGKSNAEVGEEGTPSSVKIASVEEEGATIGASTSGGGAIYNETAAPVTYYVAQIGETKYTTIEAAVAAVLDGETIIVLSDIHQDAGILFDKENVSAKLNLNNKTITIDSGSNINNRAIRIDNGALEVYGGSIIAVGAGTTSSNGTGCYGAFRVEKDGVLNAHDLNLSNARPWGLNVKVVGGSATLTNVNITSSYGGGIEVTEANLGENSKKGTAVLTNCYFTQTGYFDHCSSTLSVSGGSELTINSGTYKSENWALYVFSSGGVITVNGGTFSGNKDGKAIEAAIDTQSYPNYEGGLKLKGGSFFGGFSITLPAYMEVTGGSFSVNPSEYVTEGYAAIAIDEDPYHFKVVPVDTYEIEVKNLEELQAAIGLKFKNIKYVGSEPIDASFTVAPSVATTVKNLNVAYSSTSSSDPAMTINGPMILKNAQISSKSRCTLEIAEGQTSTLDGCTISNSGYGQSDARAININGGTVVSISGCVFSVSNPMAYTRGLNVLGDGANITVVNSTITAGEYAINLPTTAVNTTISVTESTINGWAIYNVWKDNNTIEFTECTLNSLNDKGYSAEGWNNFGAFKYNNDTLNDVIIVTDCVINVESTTGNKQYLSYIGGTGHQLKLKGQTVITGTNTNTGQYMVALSQTGASCDIDDDESVEVHWNE